MDALQFNNLSNHTKKINELQKLKLEEKIGLIECQLSLINKNWGKCISETSKKIYNTNAIELDKRILYYDDLVSQTDWYFRKFSYKNKTQKNLFQWDIFYCDLGYNIECEKNKNRPVIILQDAKSYKQAKTILIAPITTGEDDGKFYKHEIILPLEETAKKKISGKIDLAQIRAVSKARLSETFCDRLLNKEEYAKLSAKKGTNLETIQVKVKKRLKDLFCIDI